MLERYFEYWTIFKSGSPRHFAAHDDARRSCVGFTVAGVPAVARDDVRRSCVGFAVAGVTADGLR